MLSFLYRVVRTYLHTFYKQQKFEIQIPLPTSVALDAEHQRSSAYGKST